MSAGSILDLPAAEIEVSGEEDLKQQQRIYFRAWRRGRKEKGLCRNCPNLVVDGRLSCRACLDKTNLKNKKKRKEGLCHCGRLVDRKGSKCSLCFQQRNETVNFRIHNNLCITCKTPVLQKQKCDACTQYISLYKKKKRQQVIDVYGGKCACCGERELCFLHIDHIKGDGAEHRKTVKGSKLVDWLIANNFPPNFQILCGSCNQAKGTGPHCPHVDLEKELLGKLKDLPLIY